MPYILNKYYPTRNIFFAIGEGFLILSAIIVASYLYYGPEGFIADMGWLVSRSLLVTIIAQLWIYFFDLYAPLKKTAAEIFIRTNEHELKLPDIFFFG